MKIDLRGRVNESFEPVFSSHARDLVVYGGAGAGKSWAAAQKLILKCYKYPNRKVLITRKYGPSLKLTCFKLVKDDLLSAYNLPHTVNLTEMSIGFPNGSQMLFIPIVESGPSKEPAARIKSLTDVTDIWFEEPTELSFKEYQQVSLRLRGRELKEGYRQRIYTFNPIDKNHWIHAHFFDKDRGERYKFTYKDNKFIEQAYIDELEALKEIDERLYKIYALGEWGILGGQIITNYEVREFDFDPKIYDIVIGACDFGFEHPSTFNLIGLKEKEA